MHDVTIARRPARPTRLRRAVCLIEALEERVLLADGIAAQGAPEIDGAPGAPLNNVTVATYTVTDSTGSPGTKWRAKIDWGDGGLDKTVSPTALPGGSFAFEGSHTYAAAGHFTITVNIAVPGSHAPNDNTVTTS